MTNSKLVLGVGINDADYDVQPTINGKQVVCLIYSRWHNMLNRCYSSNYQSKFPTYVDCEVCDEWLTFSSFRAWMTSQDWSNKDLDKDIIRPGNKIYCPEYCAFIDKDINYLLNSKPISALGIAEGVSTSKGGRYRARVNFGGKRNHIGYFGTEVEASAAYLKEKVGIILGVAIKHSDPRVANGLRLHASILIES